MQRNEYKIITVVEKITLPKSSVAYIFDPLTPLVRIHSVRLMATVTYFGSNSEVTKFRQELLKKNPNDVLEHVGSSTDADGNNNPSEHEAQQFDGSSIPCVFETPKTSGQKKFRIKTLKPNFSQRLDKIGEEIEGGGTEESEQENSGETKEKQYVFEK